MNSLCISYDVEDYFMATCFEKQITRQDWSSFESKLVEGYQKGIEVLNQKNIKSTLFFLGIVAEKHPELVKEAYRQGHEIASHGYDHKLVSTLSLKEFDEDIGKSTTIIEDLIGAKIYGYRAPTFSLDISSQKHIDILMYHGFKYDSSYFDLSWKSSTLQSYSKNPFELKDGFWEIPLSTSNIFGIDLPIGGGYFRLYPKSINNNLIRKSLKSRDTLIYLHPWEFLDSHPFYPKNKLTKFRHTFNIGKSTVNKLDIILNKGYSTKTMIELIDGK